MRKLFTPSIAIVSLMFSMGVSAAPIVMNSDFIDDNTRTHFNGFEAIPNDGTYYTNGSGAYVEDGISVEQINGDPGNDILINCGCGTVEGIRSWYPSGGGTGYTQITMDDGSDFFDFGFYAGSGGGFGGEIIFFDLLLNNVSVLAGTIAHPGAYTFSYVGFAGGGFDTINIANNLGGGSTVYDGYGTSLALDSLETAGQANNVPAPAPLALIGLGLVALAFKRKSKLK